MVSLGLNLVLGAIGYRWLRSSTRTTKPAPGAALMPVPSTNAVKTNVIVRRLHFSWEDVESEDYAKYIGNLREISCPESTIRDIIVADVNQLTPKQAAKLRHGINNGGGRIRIRASRKQRTLRSKRSTRNGVNCLPGCWGRAGAQARNRTWGRCR